MISTEDIGNWVHTQRKKQELTQEELAAISGVGIRFIRELEQGKPSCHLAKALSVIQFLGGTVVIEKMG